MIAERQRVQHQQIYELARNFVKLQELVQELINKLGVRDENLRKLGVMEMLKDKDQGVSVESVEKFDDDHGTEH